jgi:tetratricopeptide (TPR) repeat protein
MFPGSTRLYRRTLGLMDVLLAPAPVAKAAPITPMAEPLPLIPLDLEPRKWGADPIPLPPIVEVPPPPPAAAPQPEYEWSEFSELLAAQASAPTPAAQVWAPPEETSEELTAILSDIDFQMDYGSPEEALIEIEKALARNPGHPELEKRKELAEESLRRLGLEVGSEVLKESDFAPSFFDLSDMLGDALLETGDGEEMHDATNLVEKIRSVDELFNAFREGVEQQVKGDDYDTHYNLGIAYKEMMLLDPAIEEFKNAMRDPERTLECCSMLAICEQTQGNLDAAIDWLRKGIETPGFPPEDGIGLRYDLGGLLRAQGRETEAMEQFRFVHEHNPDYREVAKLI